MLQQMTKARDPIRYFAEIDAALPVHFFCPTALNARLNQFLKGFPGLVTYAVKANPSEAVITRLWSGGLGGFDVASPEEIDLVQRLCPKAAMHYNNPVRSRAEIAHGIRAGVVSWSVDEVGELDKLIEAGARGEVAVRFRLPVAGAVYNFGAKFGADLPEAVSLLARVAAAGFTPAITFHVGTQCADPSAYATYVAAAADIARVAGVTIARLNVGGGFPSGRDGQEVDLTPFFDAIEGAMAAFDIRPALVCEPGRGLVADSFAYAVQVKSVRSGRVYLNDGIYGGLAEFTSMALPRFAVFGAKGGAKASETAPLVVFGPTCDSIDTLRTTLDLPVDLAEGDWIVFGSMGAYLTGMTTRFNGYGEWSVVTVAALDY